MQFNNRLCSSTFLIWHVDVLIEIDNLLERYYISNAGWDLLIFTDFPMCMKQCSFMPSVVFQLFKMEQSNMSRADEGNGSISIYISSFSALLKRCNGVKCEQKIQMSGSTTKKIKGESMFRQKECQHCRPIHTVVVKWKLRRAVPIIYCKQLRREWCLSWLNRQRSVACSPHQPNLEVWVTWMPGYLRQKKITKINQICAFVTNYI